LPHPVDFAGALCLSEKRPLNFHSAIINRDCNKYAHSTIFVGSDSQSSLMALNAGPLRDFMLVLVVMNKSALLRETVSDTFLQQFSSRRLDRLNQKLPNNHFYSDLYDVLESYDRGKSSVTTTLLVGQMRV